jgi:hypothetical protein
VAKFKVGQKKPPGSGRKKGAINKREQEVKDKIESSGYDPIRAMIEIGEVAMTAKDYTLAGNMAKELAQYIYPKRKSVEHTTDGSFMPTGITINFTEDPKPIAQGSVIEHQRETSKD